MQTDQCEKRRSRRTWCEVVVARSRSMRMIVGEDTVCWHSLSKLRRKHITAFAWVITITAFSFFCALCLHCYVPAPRVGSIKRWCASDVCLSNVCLSRTSGLNREQRGLRRIKLAQRQPTSHMTRTPLWRSKGQRSICRGRSGGILWRPLIQDQLVIVDAIATYRPVSPKTLVN